MFQTFTHSEVQHRSEYLPAQIRLLPAQIKLLPAQIRLPPAQIRLPPAQIRQYVGAESGGVERSYEAKTKSGQSQDEARTEP